MKNQRGAFETKYFSFNFLLNIVLVLQTHHEIDGRPNYTSHEIFCAQ